MKTSRAGRSRGISPLGSGALTLVVPPALQGTYVVHPVHFMCLFYVQLLGEFQDLVFVGLDGLLEHNPDKLLITGWDGKGAQVAKVGVSVSPPQ